jgi:hypothetical protein
LPEGGLTGLGGSRLGGGGDDPIGRARVDRQRK